ncbi:CDP-alcohol phosphatidyltransferase family protein [Clostridium scatologenes]|uniref:CDP-alcohol phosphatidyltransferase n=1 Tax=Clostridium scatologenes TaxID=1548 RepID=A0A0E3M540_CLOSL|nr:CDP-alcohol phosphatidyltransferase family protein [Clostridium scatologenes]AKA68019.1 CDP-alcohol phosphatidyltransferase [Clostridium scatologenes]
MKKLMMKLPNIITLLRVILSVFLNFYIVKHFGDMLIPIIITCIIFLTDFLDGRIARFNGSISKLGAVFDVASDLLYIIISYMVLYIPHILPLWFLFVILFKFAEFIITSYFIKKACSEKSIFIFDFLGRIAAAMFYVIPIFSYITFHIMNARYLYSLFIYVHYNFCCICFFFIPYLDLYCKFEKM